MKPLARINFIMWFIFKLIVIIRNAQATQNETENINNLVDPYPICSTWSNLLSKYPSSNIRNTENIVNERYWNTNIIINIANDIQTILINFDRILRDLKGFKEKLNNLETNQVQSIRKTRAVPRLSRSECYISKDKLMAINNEIQDTLELKQTLLTQSRCEFNLSSTNCAELIKIMECGITNLKNQLIEITSNSVSLNEITKWKTIYENMKILNSRIQDDLLKTFNQKHKTQINELNTDLHILKESIDRLQKKLEHANENLKQSTIKFCASEIHRKQIQIPELNDLQKKIPNINYTEVVIKIVETSYDYIVNVEDMPTIDYIIDFIVTLRSDLQISAADMLYEKMRQKRHLDGNYVLTFNSKIKIKSSDLSNSLNIATNNLL